MTRSKLTNEDVEWLERRLSAAMPPVAPRAEFVDGAKRALLISGALGDESDPAREALWPVALLLLAAALSYAAYKHWQARAPRRPARAA